MKKIRPLWIILLSSLAVLVLAFFFLPQRMRFWASGEKSESAPKWDRPTTAVVSSRDISFAISAAGEITPAEQVSVRPEVSGRIDKLPVDIGDRIKAGEVLFTLDDTDLQTEKSQRQIEIGGASLQATGAQLTMERSELNFTRTKELHDQKLLSQEVFDNNKLELDVARNNYAIANNNLERSKSSLQIVEDKLAKTKIVAPFDCTILTRPVSIGQAVSGASGVNSGTEVLTIADLSELIINAHINQADVTRMSVNQRVEIEVEAVPGLKLIGRVDRIAPQATIRNGIKGFATKIIVKNDESTGVRPGMTANLTIPLQSADNVLAVPIAAVFTDQGSRFAYVQQGEKFVRTPIMIGVSDYDFAEVTNGLAGGEVVSLITPSGVAANAPQAFGAAAKSGNGPAGAKGGPRAGGGGESRGAKSSGAGGKRGSG
ncbi:MAG: efflux RND transporter periplasmic adaptor subunit [Chthoniobacteraceae bacterium]